MRIEPSNQPSAAVEVSQGDIFGREVETAVVPKTVTEICSHCSAQVALLNAFVPQACPECLMLILPCGACNHKRCESCPLEAVRREMERASVRRGTEDDYHLRVYGRNVKLHRLMEKLTPATDAAAQKLNPPNTKPEVLWDVLVSLTSRFDYDTRITKEASEQLIDRMREADTHLLSDGEGNYYTVGTMDGGMGIYRVQLENMPEVIKRLAKLQRI